MRIHYLSATEIPSRLANSVHIMKMCAAFARQDHNVTLFARADERPDANTFAKYGCDASFEVEVCGAREPSFLGKLLYPFAVLRRLRSVSTADVIYGRHLFSMVMAASIGTPLIFEAHVMPQTRISKRLQSWLFRRKNFARLVTISDVLRQDYLAAFPFLADRDVLVAHDAADLADIKPKADTARTVGYVGSLYPGKGMEMVAELAKRMPDVQFLVVGGTEADLDHWKTAAPHPNIEFRGFVPHGSLPEVYGEFDIALAPLRKRVSTKAGNDDIARWTSPLKIFEYMSQGKAIICSDLPVLREILQHEETGLMVNAEDATAWEAAVRTLIDDVQLRERLAHSSRHKLEAEHTWDHRAKCVLSGIALI